MRRPVSLVACSLYCPAGIGDEGLGAAPGGVVPGFDPIKRGLPRKHLKTMTRAVQLGCAAVADALAGFPAWADYPPERRGLYVGASPQSGDPEDLAGAIAAAGPDADLATFAARGVPLIPPLWLVKGLSNNVLGYASATHDLRGDNGNWCDGRLGGSVALTAAVHAVAEGRVDLAIAGGADALAGLDDVLGHPGSDGAAFLVFVAGEHGPWRATAGVPTEEGAADDLGEMGAATTPVGLARRWLLSRDERQEVHGGGITLRRVDQR